MKKYGLRICCLLLAVSWMFMIFAFSSQHGEASSQNSSSIVERLIQSLYPNFDSLTWEAQTSLVEDLTFGVRKGAHMAEYAILAILFYGTITSWNLGSGGLLRGLGVFVATVLYAVTDEIHQLFVPGRSGKAQDVLIDAIGAFVGIFLVLTITGIVKRIRRNKNTSED